jgi:hypothetical protein
VNGRYRLDYRRYWYCCGRLGVVDARRQRKIVDRLSQHQSETIHNLHGLLLGLKASPGVNLTQVNDRLEFIRQRGEEFKRISSGGA